jgi:hypothetical protein
MQLLADGGGEWTEELMQQVKGLFEVQAAGLEICLVMPELTSRDELLKDPRFQVQGQPGNPVAFSDAVRAAVLQANDDFGCQTWRQNNRALVHAWASNNLHYVTDLDSQADIADLQQRGINLRWPDPNAG